MSTEHDGPFCLVKDKMQMSKSDARALASRMATPSEHYKCPHCPGWHIRTRNTNKKFRGKRDRRPWKGR